MIRLLSALTVSAISAATIMANSPYINGLDQTVERIEAASEQLTPQRRDVLDQAADTIRDQLSSKSTVKLAFICTHNSRRSHLAQIWATVGANRYGLAEIECVSGGTEATACNNRIVESLQRAGFTMNTDEPSSDNPRYELRFAKQLPSIDIYSKRFEETLDAGENFVAMMCCSDADQRCPVISGATSRVALHYDDPKQSDGTDHESETYDRRRDEIGAEMLYLMRSIASRQ